MTATVTAPSGMTSIRFDARYLRFLPHESYIDPLNPVLPCGGGPFAILMTEAPLPQTVAAGAPRRNDNQICSTMSGFSGRSLDTPAASAVLRVILPSRKNSRNRGLNRSGRSV